MIVVKFSTIAGGVFAEVTGNEHGPETRCFRFDKEGNAEWASMEDLASGNPFPRWYGHVAKASQFAFC